MNERAEEFARLGYRACATTPGAQLQLSYSSEPSSLTASGPGGVQPGIDKRGTRRREKKGGEKGLAPRVSRP